MYHKTTEHAENAHVKEERIKSSDQKKQNKKQNAPTGRGKLPSSVFKDSVIVSTLRVDEWTSVYADI